MALYMFFMLHQVRVTMTRQVKTAISLRRTALWLNLLGTWMLVAVVMSCVSRPALIQKPAYVAVGLASYYGRKFQGRRTASGERYNMYALTAAHPVLEFGSRVEVTNLKNGRKVRVRINDRGPFKKGRIIDLSYAAAKKIGMLTRGLVKVRLRVVP
jgi:rare lipoprotein A